MDRTHFILSSALNFFQGNVRVLLKIVGSVLKIVQSFLFACDNIYRHSDSISPSAFWQWEGVVYGTLGY